MIDPLRRGSTFDPPEHREEEALGFALEEIKKEDPLYRDISVYCHCNSTEFPYVTDFFHETRPVMQGIVSSSPRLVVEGMLRQRGHIISDYRSRSRPPFDIIRIERVWNSSLVEPYAERRRGTYSLFLETGNTLPQIPIVAPKRKGAIGENSAPMIDPAINECYLFSGHKNAILKAIVEHGQKPHLGGYHPMKGFGALGRGAYLTDRIDKAISYAACSTCGASAQPCPPLAFHVRSILLSRVILGYPHVVEEGSSLRHSTHNSMVLDENDSSNVRIAPRVESAEKDLSQYHSVVGKETYSSGGSMLKAAWYSKSFDSNEFLVRNGDQIYPEFIISYTWCRKAHL